MASQEGFHRIGVEGGPSAYDLKVTVDGRPEERHLVGANIDARVGDVVRAELSYLTAVGVDVVALVDESWRARMVISVSSRGTPSETEGTGSTPGDAMRDAITAFEKVTAARDEARAFEEPT